MVESRWEERGFVVKWGVVALHDFLHVQFAKVEQFQQLLEQH